CVGRCVYIYIYEYTHYIPKSIRTPLQIIGFRCSNQLHGHRYKQIKHLGMQTASTNICERMDRSQELSEFKRGTVISCHLCNKSIRDIPCY
ncbi:unnamed protein product, partial [Staurois parvus]